MHRMISLIKAHSLIAFLILTFSVSGGAFILDIPIVYVFGPSAAGVILMLLTYDRLERLDFWQRVTDFKRISSGWYLLIVLLFPAIIAVSLIIQVVLGGSLPQMPYLSQIAGQPLLLIPVTLEVLIRGPLSEELGWRGYALDASLKRGGVLRSSLVIAIFWWVWHLPLFSWASYGSVHYQWGWFTPEFWGFMATVIALGLLLTWAALLKSRKHSSGNPASLLLQLDLWTDFRTERQTNVDISNPPVANACSACLAWTS